MAQFDLTTPWGRFKTYLHYLWNDHAYLLVGFSNAHWVSPELVRANQPWPFQLAWWKKRGIRTIVNLRGGFDGSFYALEKDACARLGLNLVDFTITSREVPIRERVRGAKELFETLEYPALIHCKSGADRAGMMAVFYRHFHLGEPISVAMAELSKKYLHSREGLTGVLDYTLEKYVSEIEPRGISFIDWIDSPDYDPKAIRAEFKAGWWGTLLTEKLLKRE